MSETRSFSTRSVDETHALAARLAKLLAEQLSAVPDASAVVGLSGGLGAGKTEFVRGFMAALGAGREDDVSSPTYAVIHIYEGVPEVRHMDLYRLGSAMDLEAVGYRDLCLRPGISLVEWIDQVPDAQVSDTIHITLAAGGADVREIRVHSEGDRWATLLRALTIEGT